MLDKTSIVMTAFNQDALQVQITSAVLGNISKYTDREDYELILVDQGNPPPDLNHRHHCIDIDKHIKIPHIGMSAAMNRGYKESNPDYPYVCFIHNDVFVWEGWLSTLRGFIEKDPTTIMMPHQGPSTRENIKNSYLEENPRGNDDAGLIMMTKETFKKTGGWDERFKSVYQDGAFRLRFPKSHWCTGKVLITHIGSINMYTSEQDGQEAPIWQKLRAGEGKEINYL